VLRHRLHEATEEIPPGEQVEAGDRLIEDEKLWPLGERQGQGQLRSLAAGR